ncbi:MAG TPA: peptidase S8/S53 subtilisin kexin sedolisin [Hyphomonas atlantica]|uniref:Peptidase S8/S53 subtilisin kexin sedolisin n=1 Tax=Hyphomonas atlantica TaxID=1280948 RepID=A0A3B9KYM0_9PROT|nr:peptidase S8/S53 subtilisin kexin sedolisin [Hyphomonas atlantica]
MSKPAGLALGTAMAGLLALSSCDQQDLRLERARDLADSTLDQLSGRTIVEPSSPNALEAVDIADRAIAGTVRNDMNFETASASSMFAIGSIIAKPKNIPPAEAMAVVEDDALFLEDPEALEEVAEEEVALESAPDADMDAITAPAPAAPSTTRSLTVQPARVMPKIKLDPAAREQTLQKIEEASRELEQAAANEPAPVKRTRSLNTRSLESAPVIEQKAARKLARRSVISRDAITAQRDANSVMLDTLSKYGMGGEVALSREGQMVIQIGEDGASPTQFTPERAPRSALQNFLAVDAKLECPDNPDMMQVQSSPVLATECIVKDLRESGQFEYVEKDYIFENQFARKPTPDTPTTGTGVTPDVITDASITPNDPLWDLQWHFQNNGSGEGESIGGSSFQDFWTRQGTEGSEDVVVAVVDTGLQLEHPDIKDSPNIAPGWDMVSDPRMGNDGDGRDSDPNDPGDLCDPSVPYAADTFHGTHVAGTIGAAATNNASGVAGGAWNVKIVPVRALGKCGGRLSDINDAIRWAGGLIPAEDEEGNEIWNDNPADVINLSIGLFEFCPASLQDAIDSVTERGVIVVSAAGNARVATQYYAPGGCANVITVAAGDARGVIAPYSNFGPEVDILAPGGDLTRDDNGDGRPDGVLSTKAATNCYDPLTGDAVEDCYYAFEQGTSMAAPHVSAALALLKARDPDATPDELKATLLAAVSPRSAQQCSGSCALYPGTTPIEGSEGMCSRPCGQGLLDLALVPEKMSSGGE